MSRPIPREETTLLEALMGLAAFLILSLACAALPLAAILFVLSVIWR